jgi:hypothetical protein
MQNSRQKIGAQPINMYKIYDHCRRIYLTAPNKKNNKAIFDKLAGMITMKEIKIDYWRLMIDFKIDKIRKNTARWKKFCSKMKNKETIKNKVKYKVEMIEENLKSSKLKITNILKEKLRAVIDQESAVVLDKWKKLTEDCCKKTMKVVRIGIETRKTWTAIMSKINNNVEIYIREKLEKEMIRKRKQKIKRLRHKWKLLIGIKIVEVSLKKISMAKAKLEWTGRWIRCEKSKGEIGVVIKRRITEWCNNALKRKTMLDNMLLSCANNMLRRIEEKKELLERRKFFERAI